MGYFDRVRGLAAATLDHAREQRLAAAPESEQVREAPAPLADAQARPPERPRATLAPPVDIAPAAPRAVPPAPARSDRTAAPPPIAAPGAPAAPRAVPPAPARSDRTAAPPPIAAPELEPPAAAPRPKPPPAVAGPAPGTPAAATAPPAAAARRGPPSEPPAALPAHPQARPDLPLRPARAAQRRVAHPSPAPAVAPPRGERDVARAAPGLPETSPAPAPERPPAGIAAAATAQPPPPDLAPEPRAGGPAELAHRALLDVRRWIAEPAAAPDTQAPPAIAAPATYAPPAHSPGPRPPVVEEQVELSIGTINVTVEAPPAPAPRADRRVPAPSQRRGAVPRNYVRGW